MKIRFSRSVGAMNILSFFFLAAGGIPKAFLVAFFEEGPWENRRFFAGQKSWSQFEGWVKFRVHMKLQ